MGVVAAIDFFGKAWPTQPCCLCPPGCTAALLVARHQQFASWLGWAHLTKEVPHAATTPIATAFTICVSHRKNGLLNRLSTKVSFSIFD